MPLMVNCWCKSADPFSSYQLILRPPDHFDRFLVLATAGMLLIPSEIWTPHVADQYHKNALRETYYCKYNNQHLTLFATIMYFVGAFASIPGALLSKRYGRTMTMTLAGTAFVIGERRWSVYPTNSNAVYTRYENSCFYTSCNLH